MLLRCCCFFFVGLFVACCLLGVLFVAFVFVDLLCVSRVFDVRVLLCCCCFFVSFLFVGCLLLLWGFAFFGGPTVLGVLFFVVFVIVELLFVFVCFDVRVVWCFCVGSSFFRYYAFCLLGFVVVVFVFVELLFRFFPVF